MIFNKSVKVNCAFVGNCYVDCFLLLRFLYFSADIVSHLTSVHPKTPMLYEAQPFGDTDEKR
jgi:hypothetical protein